MYKNSLLCLCAIIINILPAAPVNNPASPGYIQEGCFFSPGFWMSCRAGYEGEFISNARLKQKEGNEKRIDRFELDAHSGLVVINFMNRFDLFTTLGEASSCANWRVVFPVGITTRIEMETKYDFKWGVGAKAIFFEWGNASLSLGGRYTHLDAPLLSLSADGAAVSTGESTMRFETWQIDLGLSYKIDIFIPYFGVKYSDDKSSVSAVPNTVLSNNGDMDISMKNRKNVGVFLGCGLTTSKIFALNIEARLIDEEAFSIVGEFRF